MADMLGTGAAWLAAQLKAHASRAVIVVRGSQRLAVSATKSRTEFEVDDGVGVRVEHSDADWILRPADYVFDGEACEPERGDRIEEPVGSATHVYEVMAPGGQQPYRVDPSNGLLRIHTKRVKVT